MFERIKVVTKILKVWVQLYSSVLTPSSVSEYHCLHIYDHRKNEMLHLGLRIAHSVASMASDYLHRGRIPLATPVKCRQLISLLNCSMV